MRSTRRAQPDPDQDTLFPVEPRRTADAVDKAVPRDRRDVFNGRLLEGLTLVGPYGIPKIHACTLVPERLIAFSEAVGMRSPDPQAWVHWYEDDYRIERCWQSPEPYFQKLRGFAGVLCPDYSIYRNLPTAQKINNTFRNQLLGARMQADGYNVIPNVRLSGRDSVAYALAGIPSNSTLSLGLHGCTKSRQNRPHVIDEVKLVCDSCQPANLVVYGSAAYGVLEYPLELGIPVYVYTPDSFRRSALRKAA